MTDPTDEPTTPDEDFAALLAASEAEAPEQRKLAAGDVVSGRVVAIDKDSAFIALGAKSEGVIDLTEFRDADTGELTIKIGDNLEATVTDDGSRSGSIILKRTLGRGAHLPGEIEQAYQHGIAVEGLVAGQNKGGFDVTIAGQRAFCPASQIDLRRGDPASYLGQRLQFRVTKVEGGGRNIVVSRRQLLEAEAAVLASATWERLEVGLVVQGTVTQLRDFGAFVDLGGVDGLIHVSELGHGRSAHPSEVLTIGQEVEAQVVKLEPPGADGRGKVGLSLRSLTPDPWTTAVADFPAGTETRGKVRKVEAFGAFVELAPGLDGLVHVSRLALERVRHPKDVVTVGQEVEVTVLSVDPEKRRLALSMVESARRVRDSADATQRQEQRAAIVQANDTASLGTLADLFGSKRNKS
jgi:small subunit ribosomal protein S1